MEFIGHIILTGKLECLTGFSTRGGHPSYRVGGVDLPLLRDPITRLPYIPGSLLKGKLRYLLELCYADKITPGEEGICWCDKKDCPVCPLFGVEHQNEGVIEEGCRPARVRFLDLLPTEETRKLWEEEKKQKGDFTEIKAENAVDRISRAANPRLIERVPPGACFHYEIQMGLYHFPEIGNDPLADLDKLPFLETAIRLLDDDTLGGHGSRGYGKVRLHPRQARFVSRKDYLLEGKRILKGESNGGVGKVLTAGRYREDIQRYLEEGKEKEGSNSSASSASSQGSQEIVTYMVTFRPYHTLVAEPSHSDALPFHSDTLFGALAWALRLVHSQKGPDLVEKLIREEGMVFSSIFPFVQKPDGKRLFFFPRPMVKPLTLGENNRDPKAFAGWKLASLEVFNRLINGVTEEQIRQGFCDLSSATQDEQAKAEYLCLNRKFLLTRDEYRRYEKTWPGDNKVTRPLFADTDLTRTRIDRRSGGAAEGRLFFTQEVLTTADYSGYFFLVRARKERWQEWQEPLAAALAFLADRGLGGDISAGRGKLRDLRMEKFTSLQEPTQAQRFVTLSLYYPAIGEIQDLQNCWYRLLPRKGKVEMTYLRQGNPFKAKVQMFAEGSTFPLPRDLKGCNPQVQEVQKDKKVQEDKDKDRFTVVQWGRPFAVRMK